MTEAFTIRQAEDAPDIAAVAGLFSDYAASLPIDLGYQDFAGEVTGLPGRYAPPGGALLIARDRLGHAIGCIGMRAIDDDRGEIKRLYVAPAGRGTGLGRALARAVIAEARRAGYRELLLDTLESMAAARHLYAGLGFVPVAPYYAPTPPGTLFMALALGESVDQTVPCP